MILKKIDLVPTNKKSLESEIIKEYQDLFIKPKNLKNNGKEFRVIINDGEYMDLYSLFDRLAREYSSPITGTYKEIFDKLVDDCMKYISEMCVPEETDVSNYVEPTGINFNFEIHEALKGTIQQSLLCGLMDMLMLFQDRIKSPIFEFSKNWVFFDEDTIFKDNKLDSNWIINYMINTLHISRKLAKAHVSKLESQLKNTDFKKIHNTIVEFRHIIHGCIGMLETFKLIANPKIVDRSGKEYTMDFEYMISKNPAIISMSIGGESNLYKFCKNTLQIEDITEIKKLFAGSLNTDFKNIQIGYNKYVEQYLQKIYPYYRAVSYAIFKLSDHLEKSKNNI